MKVALYARVSTEDQTCENQRVVLEKWAKVQGHEYEYLYENESTKKTRPVKDQLMQRLRTKDFDAVAVVKLDRWARSTMELLTNMEEFMNRNIGFISLSDNIDLTTATGRLHFQILAAFAEFERSLISERTKAGLARTDKPLGRPKGSHDKDPRRKSGYYLRWSGGVKK